MKFFTFRRSQQVVPVKVPASQVNDSSGGGLRRNVAAILIDAVGWPLGQSFVSPQTILPLFIALLSKSNFVVGLVVAVQSVGVIIPQLFIANRLEHMPIKRIYVVVIGILMERLPYLVLAAAIILIPDHLTLLLLFFACWIVANVGTGLNMPAFLVLFAKIIPARLRGRLGGIGNSAGTLIGVAGASVTALILQRSNGISGFSPVFAIGFVLLLISVIPLGLVDERPSRVADIRKPTRQYLRELVPLLRENRPFGLYLLFQTSLQLAYSSTPFITTYAVLKLGVATSTVGFFTALLMGATAVGSLVLGPLADKKGYRAVFIFAGICASAAYATLTFLPSLAVVYVCIALTGLLLSTQFMGNNMAMEFCTPDRAGTYTAVITTAGAPVRILGPVILGVLADRVGMGLVFLVVAALSLLSLYLIVARVSDPRVLQKTG